ncbi:MAG: hypothetical protein ACYC6N_16490 [Pirellulaceae bacterium]
MLRLLQINAPSVTSGDRHYLACLVTTDLLVAAVFFLLLLVFVFLLVFLFLDAAARFVAVPRVAGALPFLVPPNAFSQPDAYF